MNSKHASRALTLTFALVAAGSGAAHAATETFDLWNQTEMNFGFLFVDEPSDMQFVNLGFKNAMKGSWTLDIATTTTFVYSGPTVQPATGRVRIDYDYQVPQVSFQWAEVLFQNGAYAITDAGTVSFDDTLLGSARWSGSGQFSGANADYIDTYFGGPAATAVPLPNSVVLLLSAVAFMGFTRRLGGDATETYA